MKQFYITTPVYYVNDAPHIGTLYTTLAADILARYYRDVLGAENVFFLTGTDEHGQKIAEYAKNAGLEPQKFSDSVVLLFKKAWEQADIAYDYFFRTTEPAHIQEAQRIFQSLYDNGHIYKGLYEGLYCVGCEKFMTEADIENGVCRLHPHASLVEQKENNYFFRLSEWGTVLLENIQSGTYEIEPEARRNEIIRRLEGGLDDISISRESVSWGIPVPWDPSHTLYVWVEALFNYYTATRFVPGAKGFWPADVHLVGKDIVWFHTVIWEALLLAAGIELPKKIFAHGFFTIAGQKMSKSLGNVITPQQLIERYGVDAMRYLLMSAYHFGNDGDLSLEKYDITYDADLAHGLGNLVSRCARLAHGMSGTARPQKYSGEYAALIQELAFFEALVDVQKRVKKVDIYLNEMEPWKMSVGDEKREEVMKGVISDVVQIAYDMRPYMPTSAERILDIFCAQTIEESSVLFPKLEKSI